MENQGPRTVDEIAKSLENMWRPRPIYRIESEAAGNIRVFVDAEGNAIVRGTTVHLNFGDGARAVQYLTKKIKGTIRSPGLTDAQISYFEVPEWVLHDIRAASVPERLAQRFPFDNHVADFSKSIRFTQFGVRDRFLRVVNGEAIPGSGGVAK